MVENFPASHGCHGLFNFGSRKGTKFNPSPLGQLDGPPASHHIAPKVAACVSPDASCFTRGTLGVGRDVFNKELVVFSHPFEKYEVKSDHFPR